MPAFRSLIVGILTLLLFSGCGQIVSEKLTVPDHLAANSCPTGKKLVILPFADYTYADNVGTAFRRNLAIMEDLTDQLVGYGFRLPVQEDMIKYLSAHNIVKLSPFKNNQSYSKTRQLENELGKDWSNTMKNEIASLIELEQNNDLSKQYTGITALDNKTLAKIANDFDADYIVRGRILKYNIEQENTWRPLKRGLLPVIVGGTTRGLFGVAKSDTYDILDNMAVGGAMGSIVGSNVNSSTASTSTYGLAGAGVAYLASQSGQANKATVQLRLWVQDPGSGEIIWTNRVEVKVAPETIFADTQNSHLMETAVNKAVTSLVNDFITKAGEVL